MTIEYAEMFLSAGDSAVHTDKSGLIWKPVLRTGVWQVGPNGGPLHVTEGRSANPKYEIGMQDLVDNFNADAVEHVTVPVSHQDTVEQNRGFVRQLRIAKTNDGHVLMAGHDITEPDTKDMIERGTIPNTSVGLQFDYVRKEDGRKFPVVLKHVALTHRPWINRLAPFGVQASEDEYEVAAMTFSEPFAESAIDDNTNIVTLRAKVLSGEVTAADLLRYLSDDSKEVHPTIEPESTSGSTPTLPITFNSPEEQIVMDPAENTPAAPAAVTPAPVAPAAPAPVAVAEPAITAAQFSEIESKANATEAENTALKQRLIKLEMSERETNAEKFLTHLRSIGLSEENGCGAFLVATRDFMLADSGQTVVQLSEEGSEMPVSYSASGVVRKLIEALPSDDKTGALKIQFSEQAVAQVAGEPPAAAAEPEGDNDPTVALSEEELDKQFAEMFPGGVVA